MKRISWINFVLGVWLVVAPFALQFRGVFTAFWEHVILGLLIAALALWQSLASETEGVTWGSWAIAILGVWVLIAPFALRYRGITAAVWNDVIVGIVVATLAAYRALDKTPLRL